MDFVNRYVELTDLRRVLGNPRPSLIRVYGRRRSGKTELLRKLCREADGVYLLVDEADALQQRAALLFGRLTADLRIRPFGYAATRLLYPEEAEEERIRRYAVFGGTPFYHEFSLGRSLEDAVQEAFLRPTSPLVEEPQNLLRLELQSPLRHNSILYEIGQGTHSLPELETKVGVQKGGLGPYLHTLRSDMDLVGMEDPVCGIQKHARYVLADPFFQFYYRFIFENRPKLELGRGRAVWSEIERQLDSFVGFAFERVAREALTLLNGTSRVDVAIDFDQIGRWWSRQGEEIDIVAAGEDEVLAGEVSWSRHPMGPGELGKLEGKVAQIERLGNRPVRLLLVSRSGFTDGVEAEADRRGGLLLTLQDLVRVFEERYRPSRA